MDEQDVKDKLKKGIVEGDEKLVVETAQEAIKAGIDPIEAINHASSGLQVIGDRFECGEAFLPELMLAGIAMKACVDSLLPHITQMEKAPTRHKVVIGTVSGDVHDIGKNLVSAMLSVSGFEVYDLGTDVPVKRFVEKAEEVTAKVIALSSLMSTSAYYQAEVIRYLTDSRLREKYYVIVGGGSIIPQWAIQIGADGHGRLATHAPKVINNIIASGKSPPLSEPVILGY